MVTQFRDNHTRIDRVDTEKLTFILDHPPPLDRLFLINYQCHVEMTARCGLYKDSSQQENTPFKFIHHAKNEMNGVLDRLCAHARL